MPAQRPARTCEVVALIPAHNEEASIAAAVGGLSAQTHRPDRVVVVADNCTDQTARVAAGCGAEVLVTTGNVDKKAGALNQALELVLPTLPDDAYVLVTDADSTLVPDFLEAALEEFDDPNVGAVGGVFHGEPGGGMLGLLQRMEYARYARDLRRTDNVWVLTGTATVHRAGALRLVAASRGAALPGRRGDVYDRAALTEDMEITLAVKALGYRISSPDACVVLTEVMPTWPALFRQRVRWQRGALENLRSYGVSRITVPYLGQQALMAVGMLAMGLYLSYALWWFAGDGLRVSAFWLAVGLVFLTERVVTVWGMGWRQRAVAAVMLLEWAYDIFLQSVLVRAALESVLRRPEVWHHASAEGR
jgi:cellulose synthase/poly-beta-1,6-N-acetylglucosamine synthase-like glycosyltransferase